MATTTNYGWTTPDDTALVKDGAAAIRTLGSSVDTTTKALNPSTTLGDIEYRSSTSNTNTRLAIGSTAQVLTVAAGVPSWATPPASGGMTLLSTTAITASASISITGIDQTYNQLVIYVSDASPATDGKEIRMRFNTSASNSYSYNFTSESPDSGTATSFPISTLNNTGNTNGIMSNIVITNYSPASNHLAAVNWMHWTGASWQVGFGTASQVVSGAISTVSIFAATGNLRAQGNIFIYGVK
jgi:hypothetical protein